MLTYLLSSTVSEFSHSKCQISLYITTPLRLNLPTEGFPGDHLRKIFSQCQRMAKVPNGEEKLPKIPTGWVGCTNVTDRRQTTDRQTDGCAIAYSEREREFTSAKNWCHQMPSFQLKMHQNKFGGRVRGNSQRSPRHLSWIQGVVLLRGRGRNAPNFVSRFGDRSSCRHAHYMT